MLYHVYRRQILHKSNFIKYESGKHNRPGIQASMKDLIKEENRNQIVDTLIFKADSN